MSKRTAVPSRSPMSAPLLVPRTACTVGRAPSPACHEPGAPYALAVEVWFNPSCSKCRTARDQLEEAGVEYTLRRYLDQPPSEAELRAALAALGLQPWDITRMSEPLARELGLADM